MNKGRAINVLRKCGDGVLDFKGATDEESCLVTLDFNNKYIKSIKNYKRFNIGKGDILVFDWTNNEFRVIKAESIRLITPLDNILENKREEETDGESI